MKATVHLEEGSLEGVERENVREFLGIPYAAAPVGELRLRSPVRHAGWTGVRRATDYAAAAPQRLAGIQLWLNDPPPMFDEDCLYLNVWSRADASEAPVLVWFHGGATRAGSGGTAAVVGRRLSREQGIVVVTVNYRLGVLGGLAHPMLTDDTTRHFANWGMQDKIAALTWVQRSIAAFGGDPGSVTIAGQSSGAANALLISQNPDHPDLFHQIVAMSPPVFRPPMAVGPGPAAEYTEALAASVGTTVPGLRDLDGPTLVQHELDFIGRSDYVRRFGRPRTAPTLDGRLVRHWINEGPVAPVPLMIGFTRDESHFWYNLRLPDGTALNSMSPPATRGELHQEIERLIALNYDFPDSPSGSALVAAYDAEDGRAHTNEIIWIRAYSDLVMRAPILKYASRHAQRAPTYVYESSWPLALPGEGTPHAADVPMFFGNASHPYLAAKLGYGREAAEVEKAMTEALGSFVREGRPGVAAWVPMEAGASACASIAAFGHDSTTVEVGTLDRMPPFDLLPEFDPRL